MKKVLLINQAKTPHYRIPVYNYLSSYLKKENYLLTVVSEGAQEGSTHQIEFDQKVIPLSFLGLAKVIRELNPDVIIYWVNLKYLYLLPLILFAKILRKKVIYWGHGCDLLDTKAKFKNIAYGIEHAICDAIILYAEHLKKYVAKKFHKKVFIANNTLYLKYQGLPAGTTRDVVLADYGIKTKKNIICMGRMQKRKRVEILAKAFYLMNRNDVGLILVGPDNEGILDGINGDNIYKTGPIYGDKAFDLLSACDVYCLPGAVGLSIIDAFHCGLPFVTEEGDESAEIMYLKNGVNGFIVPRDNITELAKKLLFLIDDDELRKRFSIAAKQEILENGNIDKMCAGFRDAILHSVERTNEPQ
jgi:glycosyltransferase involved in cell wall biosynthesis